jgi:hypothetical protein
VSQIKLRDCSRLNGYLCEHFKYCICILYTMQESAYGNACYHLVHNLLSHLLSKNVKVRIYKTIILPLVSYGYET